MVLLRLTLFFYQGEYSKIDFYRLNWEFGVAELLLNFNFDKLHLKFFFLLFPVYFLWLLHDINVCDFTSKISKNMSK